MVDDDKAGQRRQGPRPIRDRRVDLGDNEETEFI